MSGPWEDFAPQAEGPWADFAPAPQQDPKIGQPEELSFTEKYLAPVLDRAGEAVAGDPGMVGAAARLFGVGGDARGSTIGRLAKGASDPGVAAVQLGANVVGTGDPVNKAIAEREKQYQEARARSGSEGFDPLRHIGAAGILAPLGAVGSGVARGAAVGGAASVLDPVRDAGDGFWTEKAKRAAFGAATGAALSPLMGAIARVVSPKASVNPDVSTLREAGVRPTIGQTLGGWANTLEEKAQSLPIMGDAISAMRRRSVEQFNKAVLDKTVAPIGGKVEGVGQQAVRDAGDQLSAAYERALGSVNHVNFNTPTFNAKFGELQQMSSGLTEPMRQKFDRTVTDVVLRKMSPNGSIAGADLKAVDSELGKVASRWSSGDPSHQEFADAVRQLQALVKGEVAKSNPQVAQALQAADAGWAQLVRAEGASKAAMNRDGVFTPAQYNQAVRGADKSVRKRATARGTALGQDLGTAAQNVLGNRYPDSGTIGRGMIAGLGVGAGYINPAIPAALIGGAAAYTPPVQNALAALIARRPEMAPVVANYLRQLSTPAAVGAPLLQEF